MNRDNSDKSVARCTYIGMQHATNEADHATGNATTVQQGQREELVALARKVLQRSSVCNEHATTLKNYETGNATTIHAKDTWGEHAHLVDWFLRVKDSLPTERFTYAQGDSWSITWATPEASYKILAREIEKGPDGERGEEVRSILEQLYTIFSGNLP